MKYINEINSFERWLETNYLPASSQLLWYKLIALFNRSGWAEWVVLDNQRLMGLIQEYREDTAIKIRNKLIDAGLIEYQKGKKGSPNKYKLISIESKLTFTSEVQTVAENKNTFTGGVKSVVQTVVKNGVYNEAQTADIKKEKDINKDIDKDKDTRGINTSIGAKALSTSLPVIPYQQIVEMYNSICISFKPVKTITDKRKQAIGARYREHNMNLDNFKKVFELVQTSSFLKGENNRNWTADFDWIMKPNNFVKVIERKYDNKQQTTYCQQPKTVNSSKSFADLATEVEMEGLL